MNRKWNRASRVVPCLAMVALLSLVPSGRARTLAGGRAPTTATAAVTKPNRIAQPIETGARTAISRAADSVLDLFRVSCPKVHLCVAVGYAAITDYGVIYRSEDGGQTWVDLPSGTKAGLTGVSCADDAHCVAVGNGGTILASGDDGRTWTSRKSGTVQDLESVSCSTARLCVAVGGITANVFVVSRDGGTTWSSQTVASKAALFAVNCSSATKCVGVGSSIEETADAGRTWTKHASGTPNRLVAVTCPTAGFCLAAGYYGALVTSIDGGRTWIKGSALPNWLQTYGVDCLGVELCVAAAAQEGGNGVVLFTSDHGRTWMHRVTKLWSLNGVSCPGVTLCVAVGEGGTLPIISSRDGARTWASPAANATS